MSTCQITYNNFFFTCVIKLFDLQCFGGHEQVQQKTSWALRQMLYII